MASVKFTKDSTEFQMFADYWNLCQKYWEVETDEKYWEELVLDIDDFHRKYSNEPLAKKLALALVDYLEERNREHG